MGRFFVEEQTIVGRVVYNPRGEWSSDTDIVLLDCIPDSLALPAGWVAVATGRRHAILVDGSKFTGERMTQMSKTFDGARGCCAWVMGCPLAK